MYFFILNIFTGQVKKNSAAQFDEWPSILIWNGGFSDMAASLLKEIGHHVIESICGDNLRCAYIHVHIPVKCPNKDGLG